MPRIGDQAPEYTAATTLGPIKFSEYNKGSRVIFFSHPADFTPVCTTEMSGFTLEQESFFNKKNTKLLGLSIDSIHSHIAWVDNVKKYEERVNSNYEMVDFYLAKKQLT